MNSCLRHILSKRCGCLLLAAVSLPLSLHAGQRKDITDPVLQELISTYAPRMPHFVDRHGASVFVADEAVSRENFLYALYEYEKWLKSPKSDLATRQEVSEKVAAADLTRVLQPRMAALLDGSLESSTVFAGFKESFESWRQATQATVAQTQADMCAVAKRLDMLTSVDNDAPPAEGQHVRAAQVGRTIAEMQRTFAIANDELRHSVSQLQREVTVLAGRSNAAGAKELRADDVSAAVTEMQGTVDRLAGQVRLLETAARDMVTRQEYEDMRAALNELTRKVGELEAAKR